MLFYQNKHLRLALVVAFYKLETSEKRQVPLVVQCMFISFANLVKQK